jgi:hypothetical protein
MQRLIRIVFINFLVLTVLCGATIFVGRKQPQADILPELKPCGDSWCYLGIVLGKTSLNEGMVIIRDNPKIKPLNSGFQHIDPLYTFDVIPNADDSQHFENISLDNLKLPLPVGNIINILGPPCYVTFWGGGELEVGYSNSSFYAASPTYTLTPTSPVESISLTYKPNELCDKATRDEVGGYYEWRGFVEYIGGP